MSSYRERSQAAKKPVVEPADWVLEMNAAESPHDMDDIVLQYLVSTGFCEAATALQREKGQDTSLVDKVAECVSAFERGDPELGIECVCRIMGDAWLRERHGDLYFRAVHSMVVEKIRAGRLDEALAVVETELVDALGDVGEGTSMRAMEETVVDLTLFLIADITGTGGPRLRLRERHPSHAMAQLEGIALGFLEYGLRYQLAVDLQARLCEELFGPVRLADMSRALVDSGAALARAQVYPEWDLRDEGDLRDRGDLGMRSGDLAVVWRNHRSAQRRVN